jgi:hypothetical protein
MLKVELDMAESALTKTNGLGWMTREQWQSLKDSLIANDGLKGNPDVTTAYTDKILNLAYKRGQLVWP